MQYKTEQVVLKEKFIGHDAKNLSLLDNVLNRYATPSPFIIHLPKFGLCFLPRSI